MLKETSSTSRILVSSALFLVSILYKLLLYVDPTGAASVMSGESYRIGRVSLSLTGTDRMFAVNLKLECRCLAAGGFKKIIGTDSYGSAP